MMDHLPEERVEELLAAAARVRCLVVGDVMLDRYVTGAVDRISPEAPVPVVRVESESSTVGGAANVAHNAVALGAACAVVGVAGNDAGGVLLRRELDAIGIDTTGLVATDDRPTTMKTRVMARRHQVARFDHESDDDVDGPLVDALARAVREGAESADVLVIEDYNKGVLVPAVIAAVLEASAIPCSPSVSSRCSAPTRARTSPIHARSSGRMGSPSASASSRAFGLNRVAPAKPKKRRRFGSTTIACE